MKSKSIGRLAVKFICIVLALLFIDLFFGGIFSPLPYRSLAPFHGRVVDAETKEPIAGAVVLAVYYLSRLDPGGGYDYTVDGQETLTDENGEFRLPRKRRWFVLRRGYPEGDLEIFKPGYGNLWHSRSTAVGENKSWPPPGKFVLYELPKLNTLEERKKTMRFMYPIYEICFNKQKIYMKMINEERRFFKLDPYPEE